MSKFLRSVAAGVQQTAEIAKLQKIIDRRIEQYHREITQFLANINKLPAPEEVQQFEQELIDRCLREYDEEAVPFMKHPVNPNWAEGGGDNLEVRKRMLYRELEKRRGHLAGAIKDIQTKTTTELQGYVSIVRNTENQLLASLPTDVGAILNRFTLLEEELNDAITPTFPGGYKQFNLFVNDALENEYLDAKARVIDQNRLKLYEDSVAAWSRAIDRLYSKQEIEEVDQTLIETNVKAYTEHDLAMAGRTRNFEERVSNLRNVLQSRRGPIASAIQEIAAKANSQLDGYHLEVKTFEDKVKKSLPTESSFVHNQYNELKEQLHQSILPQFDGGFDRFDRFVNGSLFSAMKASKRSVLAENKRLTEKVITEYRNKVLNDFQNTIASQATEASIKLKAKLTSEHEVITSEVIEDVRNRIDTVLARYLEELRKIAISNS